MSGQFEGFNRWLEPKECGRIDEADPAATKLIGLDSSVLATLLPSDPENGPPGAAPNDGPATLLDTSEGSGGGRHR